ncbi:amidohydrolase family protein [Longispora albida]|uniref:amidohydrolase family protein n=1 Tax=Longispora albida TaxID=203523 RepID=UPI0003799297|nr:amidohydrolase family protein [Longispora albida]
MHIPYERYFDLRAIPKGGMALDSYEYLSQVTASAVESSPIWDAHTHLGTDTDGKTLTAEALLADLARFDVAGAVVFPFNDPDQGEDFGVPNQRIWDACLPYSDRLVPFMRLNPHGPWEAEYERCLARGHRGVKLHPRAQEFDIAAGVVRGIYKRAADDGLPVLVHTGYGMPAISQDVAAVAEAYPELKLILGHASFIDMPRALSVLKPYPNVYFETSVVRMYDLFQVLREVDPGRVMYGSDKPYSSSTVSLQAMGIMASLAGVAPERLPDLFGGNLLRVLGVTSKVAA